MNTKNNLNYRKLPFFCIFIDIDIEILEGIFLKGIIINDFSYYGGYNEEEKFIKENVNNVVGVCFDFRKGFYNGEFNINSNLNEKGFLLYKDKLYDKDNLGSNKEMDLWEELNKKVSLIAVNIIDLINNNCDEIKKIYIKANS